LGNEDKIVEKNTTNAGADERSIKGKEGEKKAESSKKENIGQK